MNVAEHFYFFGALYKLDQNPEVGTKLLYLTILGLSILVYKLGFAQKLPILKSIIIYLFLIFRKYNPYCFWGFLSNCGRFGFCSDNPHYL